MLLRLLYTLLLSIVAPILLFSLYKKKDGKPSVGSRWKEHFGKTPPLNAPASNSNQAPIWIHSVSVGETIAVTPFILALRKSHPHLPIIITTTTPTGAEQAKKLTHDSMIEHRYMPLDFKFAIHGFLKTIQPQKLLIMETELWPNTLHYVSQSGVEIHIINARLSERSTQKYKKIRPIFHWLTRGVSQVLCQYQLDSKHFISLGMPSSKIHTTGSLKFDIQISKTVYQNAKVLRELLGENRPVWIAASTHHGEDEQILNAHHQLLKKYPDALLILVPRHPERFNQVDELIQSLQLPLVRRTQSLKSSSQCLENIASAQVYLGDTMGEMLILIGASDICFMGGSLIGDKVGGHNLLEPAALAKPLITGPSYYNFTEITTKLQEADAVTIIDSAKSLANELDELFENQQRIKDKGQAALSVVKGNQGAIQKTIDYIF